MVFKMKLLIIIDKNSRQNCFRWIMDKWKYQSILSIFYINNEQKIFYNKLVIFNDRIVKYFNQIR